MDETEDLKMRLLEQSAFHKKMLKNGFKRFSSTQAVNFSTMKVHKSKNTINAPLSSGVKVNLVAIIGDRFMNGGFVSAKELRKCYKYWEGTLHDINHMGTSTGFFLIQTDITYFIGYHKNVKYNAKGKSVSMELKIHDKTHFAEDWKAYIELCEMAGQIPNVSVTYYGKQSWVPVDQLPPEADWQAEGYGKDDLVPVLTEMIPVCVSTVLEGRCNDKDGCGIRNANSTKCGSESCDCGGNCPVPTQKPDEKLETKRQEIIERIKKLEKIKSEDIND